MKNSFLKLLLSSSLIVGSTIASFNSTPIKAASSSEPVVTACDYSIAPIPEEGEVILLEDLSYTEPQPANSIARSPSRVNVNQTYAIRIQDVGGSCVSSAKVNISGYYYYDGGTASVSDIHLSARVTYVPALWTCEITNQWATPNMSKLTYTINYRSYVNDPYSCLVGGGYWYSGANFSIR